MKKIDHICKCCGSTLSVRQIVGQAIPHFKKNKAFTIKDVQKLTNKPYEDVKLQLKYLQESGVLKCQFITLPSINGRNSATKVFLRV